jgi:uncharacterized protein YqjF (DUF2071 family)
VQRQDWRDLLFLHWEVPASVLRPRVPPELDIDTFEGRAFVGLVPFTMTGVRPVWAPPLPLLSSFHEVNVRTYVHRGGRDPGVWFLSLDASSRVAVAVARTRWSLPYHFARMSLVREEGGWVRYASERRWPGPRPARCALRYAPQGVVTPAIAGSLDHFLVERYLLYARRGERLLRGKVRHAAYPLQAGLVQGLEEDLLSANGLPRPADPPLAHYARGVAVEVFPLSPAA